MTPEQHPNPDVPPSGPPPPPPPPPPLIVPPAPIPSASTYGASPFQQSYQNANVRPQHVYTLDGIRLASTGVRVAARLIDFVLLSIVSFIGGLISSAALGRNFDYDAYRTTSGIIGVVVAVGSIAYFLFGESVFGSTLGKLVLGVKVRSATGGNMDFAHAFKRNSFVLPMYLGSVVSSMILLGSDQDLLGSLTSLSYGGTVGILGTVATVGISIALIVSISNSPNLLGYHDRMAQAVVVTTR